MGKDAQIRVCGGQLGQDIGGVVGAAVIDDKHLTLAPQLVVGLKAARHDVADGGLFVARGHDHGDRI